MLVRETEQTATEQVEFGSGACTCAWYSSEQLKRGHKQPAHTRNRYDKHEAQNPKHRVLVRLIHAACGTA